MHDNQRIEGKIKGSISIYIYIVRKIPQKAGGKIYRYNFTIKNK